MRLDLLQGLVEPLRVSGVKGRFIVARYGNLTICRQPDKPLLPPESAIHSISRDTVQPDPKSTGVLEFVNLLEDTEPDILQDVISSAVAVQPPDIILQSGLAPGEQLLEGVAVAVPAAKDYAFQLFFPIHIRPAINLSRITR